MDKFGIGQNFNPHTIRKKIYNPVINESKETRIMNEKRKAWLEKYRQDIPADGFIAEYCTPEHVRGMLGEDGIQYYIGFDGERKTYTQLTEEEKQDFIKQGKEQDISKVLGILKDMKRITDKEER